MAVVGRPPAPQRYAAAGAPQLTVVPPPAEPRKLTTRAQRTHQSLLARLFPTFFGGTGSISRSELAMLSRQLATFLGAGIPITQALTVIATETRSATVRNVMRQVLEDLSEGLSVSESFAKYPKVFGVLYVNLVRAAELTGTLDRVLRQLDVYLTKQDALKKKISGALVYPILVLFMAFGSVGVLVTFVLPRYRVLFDELKADLPGTTKLLLAIANFTTTYRDAIVNVIVLTIAFLVLSQRFAAGRYVKDWLLLRIPIIKTVTRYAVISRFMRTLASMLAAGVPIARSFDVVADSVGNRVYRRRLRPVRDRLMAGEGFARPLAESRLFPPTVIQMVAVGEETGSLDKFLAETADFYDSELEYRLASALALLEPALMVVVGGIVGFVAVSLVSAIYSITGSFR